MAPWRIHLGAFACASAPVGADSAYRIEVSTLLTGRGKQFYPQSQANTSSQPS